MQTKNLIIPSTEFLLEFGRSAVEDPIKVFNFVLEFDGFARAGFSEITGLEMAIESTDYREGGFNNSPKKSAGQASFPNITCKRGQIIGSRSGGDDDFLEWAEEVFDATSNRARLEYRRTGDIVQYYRNRTEAARWRIGECFPVRYKPFSDLNAEPSDDSIEELELSVEYFYRI